VNQSVMEWIMDGMVVRKWKVDGVPTSLCDLGYCEVGLDDSWQDCREGRADNSEVDPFTFLAVDELGYSYHDADGRPMVSRNKFWSMHLMTDRAHGLGLKAGWYGNNCICSEGRKATKAMYEKDVESLIAFGFDSVKLDKCGSMQDLDLWASLLNKTGKPVMIENCHWGLTVPTATWCPWNVYRTSGDIRAQYGSMVSTLLTTARWARAGLSRPGCWAYPDMMQVGCKHGPGGPSDPGMSFKEARSHFGAWCIVSSPLVLSHDVSNDTVMEEIWPIISNREAIAVNQAWAGHSGSPFKQSATNITLLGFADQTEKPIIGDKGVAKGKETPLPSWHFFYKPLGSGRVAVLLMSHTEAEQSLTVHFADVPGLPCSRCSVRDVWLHEDAGVQLDRYTVKGLTGHDSAFLILSPEPRASHQAFEMLLHGSGASAAAQPEGASAPAPNATRSTIYPSAPVSNNKYFRAAQLDSRGQRQPQKEALDGLRDAVRVAGGRDTPVTTGD